MYRTEANPGADVRVTGLQLFDPATSSTLDLGLVTPELMAGTNQFLYWPPEASVRWEDRTVRATLEDLSTGEVATRDLSFEKKPSFLNSSLPPYRYSDGSFGLILDQHEVLMRIKGRRFIPAEWHEAGPSNERAAMLGDLIINYLPLRTEKEVTAALGPSLPNTFPYEAASWDMVYKVTRVSMDHLWVLIRLKDGVVADVVIYED